MCTRPGASGCDPNLAPVRGAELPGRPEDLRDKVDPTFWWSKIKVAGSKQVRLCADVEGPNQTSSMTLKADTKPSRERPKTGMPKPACAGLLTGKEGPKVPESKAETELSN